MDVVATGGRWLVLAWLAVLAAFAVLAAVVAVRDRIAQRPRRRLPGPSPRHPARRAAADRGAKPLTAEEREQWDALAAELSVIVLPGRCLDGCDEDRPRCPTCIATSACDLTRDEGSPR